MREDVLQSFGADFLLSPSCYINRIHWANPSRVAANFRKLFHFTISSFTKSMNL